MIADKTRIADDLQHCFGKAGREIFSLAYYLVLEEGAPAYRLHKWRLTHKHPYGADFPAQRNNEIFAGITEDTKLCYFKRQEKRHSCDEYLALLYEERAMLPISYRRIPENIMDVKTIENLMKDIDYLPLVNSQLIRICDGFAMRFNYNSNLHLYVQSFMETWNNTEEKQISSETVKDKRRIYLHVYYNNQKTDDDKDRFYHLLERLKKALINGTKQADDEELY